MVFHTLDYKLDLGLHFEEFDKDHKSQFDKSLQKDLVNYYYFDRIPSEGSFLWVYDISNLQKNKE